MTLAIAVVAVGLLLAAACYWLYRGSGDQWTCNYCDSLNYGGDECFHCTFRRH